MNVRDLIPWGRTGSPTTTRGGDIHPFVALHREMNRLFDDFVRGFEAPVPGFGSSWGWPRTDLVETDREYRVIAELPGLEEKDIDIVLNGDVLTLKGESRVETEGQNPLYTERFHGRFQRSIGLGPDIDPDKVSASFRNGVLTIVLPKTAEAETKAKRIPIDSR